MFRGADSPLSVIGQVVGQVAARRYGAVGYWKWERYATSHESHADGDCGGYRE